MTHNPFWHGKSSSANQDILHILCNPEDHHRHLQSTLLVSILTQTNSVHATIHFTEDSFKYFPPSYTKAFEVVSFPEVPHQNPVWAFPLPHTCNMPRWFDQSNNLQNMNVIVMQSSPVPVTSFLLGPNTFLRALFSNIMSPCSFLNMKDQVSHPYKTW